MGTKKQCLVLPPKKTVCFFICQGEVHSTYKGWKNLSETYLILFVRPLIRGYTVAPFTTTIGTHPVDWDWGWMRILYPPEVLSVRYPEKLPGTQEERRLTSSNQPSFWGTMFNFATEIFRICPLGKTCVTAVSLRILTIFWIWKAQRSPVAAELFPWHCWCQEKNWAECSAPRWKEKRHKRFLLL